MAEFLMNINVMFSSKTDMWSTPQDFFDTLNAEFHFTIIPRKAPSFNYGDVRGIII